MSIIIVVHIEWSRKMKHLLCLYLTWCIISNHPLCLYLTWCIISNHPLCLYLTWCIISNHPLCLYLTWCIISNHFLCLYLTWCIISNHLWNSNEKKTEIARKNSKSRLIHLYTPPPLFDLPIVIFWQIWFTIISMIAYHQNDWFFPFLWLTDFYCF